MTKEECQEQVAKVICDKSDEITCDECFRLSNGHICEGLDHCRISEKTEEQLKYVLSSAKKDTFLRACAGSGKTEVVGMKAAYEIKKWKERNKGIAVLSFTNDATDVIKDRVKRFAGNNGTYPHYIGTLSSFIHNYIVQPFAYKFVGYQGKNSDFSLHVVDENVSIYSNHWLMNYKCSIHYLSSQNKRNDIYAHQIGFDFTRKDFYFYIGSQLVWLKDYYQSDRIQKYIHEKRKKQSYYWEWKYVRDCFLDCKKEFWKQGYANFDDLNFLAVRILKKNIGSEIAKRFPFILIDECQDLSGNELEVLRQLKENGCCIHFIGDLNQSIYEFKRVSPDNIADYVKDFEKYTLSNNFRSCTEIVSFSEKLIGKSGSISQNVESKFGNHSLVYIEYRTPEEAIEKYVRLLDSMGCKEYDNKILVKQNALRKQLEKTTQNEFDTKEPLVVAVQLWKEKAQSQMSMALELSGLQISKWFGGGRTKKNYYCPKEITSVFAWRIYLMTVLNAIEKSETLMDFNQTYGKWHEKARKELNDILKCQYSIISNYDENKEREIEKLVNGNNFKDSNGNKDVVISNFVGKFVTDIPVMTIHGSKGCTYDTTLVISSENAQSEGGHWKAHWIEGDGEAKRIGYVASTRAKYLLVWGVPILKKKDRELLENYGFISSEEVTNDVENEECT